MISVGGGEFHFPPSLFSKSQLQHRPHLFHQDVEMLKRFSLVYLLIFLFILLGPHIHGNDLLKYQTITRNLKGFKPKDIVEKSLILSKPWFKLLVGPIERNLQTKVDC